MARAQKAPEAAGDSAADQQLREEASAVAAEGTTPDLVLAAQKRAAAAAVKDPAERVKQEIDALLVERRGYVSRVAQVDKQLGARGYSEG